MSIMESFAWLPATSIAEAVSEASSTVAKLMAAPADDAREVPAAILKAGGIDVLDLMKERLLRPGTIVNLRDVPGLAEIAPSGRDGLKIGSMVTLASLARHPLVRRQYPALASAAAGSASPQIRHIATLGGNLLQRPRCWYFRDAAWRCLRKGGEHCFARAGDHRYHAVFDNKPCAMVHPSTVATILVALHADIELAHANGAIRRQKLEEFLRAPDDDITRENRLEPHEILVGIVLPALPAGARMVHLRRGEKESFDWPLADVAVVLDRAADGTCGAASVVLGAVAPTPYRARAAEELLKGRRVDANVAIAAAGAALTGATPLPGNAYKVPLIETLVRRAVLAAASA